jgi:hypothetical protein
MKRHAKKLVLLLGLLVAVGAWLYFTPHLTIRQMSRAAQKGDSAAFMSHVDFPALRTSLQTNLTAAIVPPPTNANMAAFQTMFVRPSIDKALAERLAPEKLSAEMMAIARTNSATSKRYLDLNTFAAERDAARAVFIRHGIATWKLSRIDGAAVPVTQ